MAFDPKPRLLTDEEIEQIRIGIREGFRGPVMYKWVEDLLADHDERVRLAREGGTEEGRHGGGPG